jgi:hypothetical protein
MVSFSIVGFPTIILRSQPALLLQTAARAALAAKSSFETVPWS